MKFLVKKLLRSIDTLHFVSHSKIWQFLLLSSLSLMFNFGISQAVTPDFVSSEPYPSAVSSVTITMPTGSAIGDLVMVNIVTDDDGSITQPVEFTELAELWQGGNGPTNGLYYRVIDGTEAATYVFSFPAEPAIVTTFRFNNASIDSANPINTFLTQTGVDANPLAPSIITSADGKTILQFVGVDGASAGTLASNTASNTVFSADQSGDSQGAEMMATYSFQELAGATPIGSYSFASEQWVTISVALNTYYVSIVSPANGSCLTGSTTLNANYEVATSTGNFELVDPSGTVLATQSYATSTGSVSINFTPTTSGTYTVREQSAPALNGTVTFYVDTDGDSICDLFDIDDDNDGVLDHTESPNCFLTLADVPYETGDRRNDITVTTDWTVNNGTLANILDGNTAANAVRKTNGDFTFTGQEFLHFTLPYAVTFDQITLHHEGAIFLDVALGGLVQGSNDGAAWTDLTVAGTVLPDAASPHIINLTQNLGDFSHYRIFVTSGQIDDDEYLREVEFSMIFDPSKYPIDNCSDDVDGDLIPNHQDLDSDGDTCSDALEAGATTDLTADFQFPIGTSGANGLPDIVETPVESGMINYNSTYDPDAISDVIRSCFDSDGDTVVDAFDLDDDNDGILDAVEKSAPCIGDSQLSWTRYEFATNIGNTSLIPLDNITGTGTSPTIDLMGVTGTTYGLIFTGYLLIAENGNHSFTLSSDDGSSLAIDGSEIINQTGGTNSSIISLNIGWHELEVRFYENTGGENLSLTYQPPSAGAAQSIPSEFFATTPPECDTDGLPNQLDLDSDGDGIPDNVEGQPTLTYVPPASNTPAQYLANNGVNTAYIGGINPSNTDTDVFPDYIDLESDEDRILDADESGLPVTGSIAPNGMDDGVKTSNDYSDVNGIVNDPNVDLAHVTTTTTEADYRDKKPPAIVKVCYNSDPYSISGTWLTFADDKLLNLNNWGPNGTDVRYQFELFSFGTGPITELSLAANGCQIFYAGGTNSDAGNFNPGTTSALSTTDKDALRNWAASPNNVIISAQGYGAFMGGVDYAGSSGNTNPNSLTPLGEVVISGLFGQTTSFNQGGGYQGRFTAFPSTACVITQDNNDNPTGLLDGVRGDFYFADFDMLSELGGMTSNNGISSNTDMFFANLFSSAAMIAIEGPENACAAFLCPAGDQAPVLTSANVSSAGLPVDLNTLFIGTPPVGALLTWHNASPVADENYIGNATNYTESGVVFAAFRAEDGSCYSPSTPVTVTINYPDLEVSISPGTETSAQGEVQSFTITVTNNGPITAPDAIVKVPLPDERELILANPSLGSYSGSTQLWSVGQLTNGQSATLDITIRLL